MEEEEANRHEANDHGDREEPKTKLQGEGLLDTVV
jgi:hypothetical protein